jgi:hypothetical protein
MRGKIVEKQISKCRLRTVKNNANRKMCPKKGLERSFLDRVEGTGIINLTDAAV